MYRQSVALLSLLAAVAQAANGWSCKDNQSAYPYCVYVQGQNAPDGGAWPTMMFLPGSGARGDASQANYLVGYDGHGKMVQRYLDGTRSGPEQIAAEQFLTIVPIASMSANTRHFDPDKILAILNEVKASYNVDSERCYISGFSMGARGTWRSLVFHPEIWAAGAPSAGAAENTGASTLSQEYALATFPSLNKVLNIPIRQFDGLSDTTAGFKDPQSTQAEIVKLGGKLSTLTEMSGKDHSAMSTAPWTDTDLLSWFLKQQRSGGTSSPSTKTSAPSATQVDSGKGGHASQSPVATDSDGSDGEGEDDEDCDDDEEDEDEYDEDCDEDDESADSNDGEDDEEDCEDDDSSSTNTKRSLTHSQPLQVMDRQSHHFVFDHSKRAPSIHQHIAHLQSRQHVAHMNRQFRRNMGHASRMMMKMRRSGR